jgi:hypothetical protein
MTIGTVGAAVAGVYDRLPLIVEVRMHRLVLPLFAAAAFTGCGTVEYRDTNAAVDADPLCASQPDRPGEPIAKRCERVSGGKITFGESKSEPLDLKGTARKDDDPR